MVMTNSYMEIINIRALGEGIFFIARYRVELLLDDKEKT